MDKKQIGQNINQQDFIFEKDLQIASQNWQ